jgi:hypothetical protein
MATLLQNVQNVCLELGLPSPNAVATSTDPQILQIQALLNRAGDILSTERDWQVLASEYRFETVYYTYTGDVTNGSTTITNLSSVVGLSTDFMATGTGIQQDSFLTSVGVSSAEMSIPSTQTATGITITFGQAKYSMPADYARIVNKTQYNKSNRWSIIGPKDAQEWQWLKASYVTTGPRMRFRIMGDKFTLWPMPTSILVMGFEYVSNAWVVGADGTLKTSATNDTDTFRFPDRLLVLGTKLKLFEIKGFDTTALLQDYTRELDKWKASESGADTLSLAPKYPNLLLTQNNLPDTGFGNATS